MTAIDIETIISSEEFQNAFVDGFSAAAPDWYNVSEDTGDNPNPWCCPWYWAEAEEFYRPELGDAEAMGRAWAEKNSAEMTELHDA